MSTPTAQHSIFRTAEGAELLHSEYRELLALWPVANRQHCVSTAQGNTFVVESGTPGKPVLVLLHGSMSTSAMWMHEAKQWEQDYHLFAIDLIGEAGLSTPVRPPLGSADYAQWLDEVLDGLQISQAHFIGTSLGGWFCLDYAMRRGNRVLSLVLQSPGGIGVQRSILWWVLPLSLLGRWGKNKVRERLVGTPPAQTSEAASRLGALLALIPKHFRPRLEKLPLFTDEQLAQLQMPVLLIVGGKDRMLDAEQIRRRAHAHIPHLILRYLPDGLHFLGDQTPAIGEFLTRVGGNNSAT
ncbi:MAG: alpha/beta hydrolase [Pseudomonadales bacterium]|nr:alpha/beta hydrolase [Pseudomonadales bacterium]